MVKTKRACCVQKVLNHMELVYCHLQLKQTSIKKSAFSVSYKFIKYAKQYNVILTRTHTRNSELSLATFPIMKYNKKNIFLEVGTYIDNKQVFVLLLSGVIVINVYCSRFYYTCTCATR